jgi:hypothetical protein
VDPVAHMIWHRHTKGANSCRSVRPITAAYPAIGVTLAWANRYQRHEEQRGGLMGSTAMADELERVPIHTFASLEQRGSECNRARMGTLFPVITPG